MINSELKPKYEIGFSECHNQHLYTVGDQTYPSVTGILGIIGGEKTNRLMGWAKKESLNLVKSYLSVHIGQSISLTEAYLDEIIKAGWKRPQKILEEAADIGSRAHNAIDDLIKTGRYVSELDVIPIVNNFNKWIEQSDMKIIKGDMPVVSLKYGFGGRLDALAEIAGGERVIIDFKTSNNLYDEYACQVAAYAQAFAETFGVTRPKLAWIIRFDKTKPEFEPKQVKSVRTSFKAFLAAKTLKDNIGKAYV